MIRTCKHMALVVNGCRCEMQLSSCVDHKPLRTLATADCVFLRRSCYSHFPSGCKDPQRYEIPNTRPKMAVGTLHHIWIVRFLIPKTYHVFCSRHAPSKS